MLKLLAFFLVLPVWALSVPLAYSQQNALPDPVAPGVQNPQIVAEVVAEFIQTQAEIYPGSAQVSVETPRITNQPECHDLQPFLSSGQRLRPRQTVGVRCLAPQPWTSYVQVNLSIQGFYYVANRTLNPGDVLSLDDMIAREGDILRLTSGVIFDPSQAIGYVVSQRIPTGSPIKATSLRDAQSVQRGQRVRTIAQGVGFSVTGEGQALENGNPGALIQVRTSSGQVISGIVVDATTVQIPM
jgi:flagella basal body P-ring formation protein FlgA